MWWRMALLNLWLLVEGGVRFVVALVVVAVA